MAILVKNETVLLEYSSPKRGVKNEPRPVCSTVNDCSLKLSYFCMFYNYNSSPEWSNFMVSATALAIKNGAIYICSTTMITKENGKFWCFIEPR